MKALFVLVTFTLLSFASFSQDVIFMNDGTKIEAKVQEITTSSVKYLRFDQPDGPVRTVYKSKIKEIIYENGTWDNFESEVTTPPATETTPVTRSTTRTPRKPTKDFMFSPGFSFEGLISYANRSTETTFVEFVGYDSQGYAIYDEVTVKSQSNYIGINLRLGSKWYFGSSEKYRPGIQVSWLRLALLVNPESGNSNPIGNLFAPVNVGFANAIKFNDNIGMEVNASLGFVMLDLVPPPFNGTSQNVPGLMYGVEAKFRYNKLAIGLDYSRVETQFGAVSNNRSPMNVVSISVGAKF